jgi:Xaa-Pro aminopeptidase
MLNQKFHQNNRQKLSKKLKSNSIMIISSGNEMHKSADSNFPFQVNKNFYYLSGLNFKNTLLVLIKTNSGIKEYLFIEKPNDLTAKWTGQLLDKDDYKKLSGIENIQYISQFKSFIYDYVHTLEHVELYLDITTPKVRPIPTIRSLIQDSQLRLIKAPEEIDAIQQAINITEKGLKFLTEKICHGCFEYELEAAFEYSIKCQGNYHPAFETIVAAGKNATVLHYVNNNSVVSDNDLILFDLGAEYKEYSGDISRTIPSHGKMNEKQKIIYAIVLEGQKKALEYIKPDITLKELQDNLIEHYYDSLKILGYATEKDDVSRYYYHGISHSLGLDTHDVGGRNLTLKENMIITVEPGLYISEDGIGIRIEDDVLITATGCEVLSKNIPKEIDDIIALTI